MFVESNKPGQQQGRIAAWLDSFGRRHPAAFEALLVVLTMTVTVVLLIQIGSSFVLYQGF